MLRSATGYQYSRALRSPDVSIILPTQGARASLESALRSALAQRGATFEVVIVDDSEAASDWKSRPEFAPLLADPRVRIVPLHAGRGCAAAKNAGLCAARGEWVCYLDDDNEYLPGKISLQLLLARSSGSPLVLCGLIIQVGGRRRIRQADCPVFRGEDRLLRAMADTNVLFHRRANSPAWDEELGTVDDACFCQAWITTAKLAEVPNVARPLVLYRSHGGERANVDWLRVHRGYRRLLVRWSHGYSRATRRVLLCRLLVAREKFRHGGWAQFAIVAWRLWQAGGWAEWRTLANASGVKIPVLRRWMVS